MPYANIEGTCPIRILVADSSRIHTQLLAEALQRTRELHAICSVLEGSGSFSAADADSHDVAIISANIDGDMARGFELIRKLRASHPTLRSIVLMDAADRDSVLEAFRAGARGIFRRQEPVESLCKCVRTVHQGQIWATGEQMLYAVEALAAAPTVRALDSNGFNLLSQRELQVVQYLAEGLTNREIAQQLKLSQHTIKNYLFRIFDKLGVSSRIELLFMTLSQAGSPQQSPGASPHNGAGPALHRKAAEQGFPTAQLELARMYAEGDRVQKDPEAAYMWYLVSERSTTEITRQAAATRKQLAALLTPQQIASAERKALFQYKKQPAGERDNAMNTALAMECSAAE